MNIIFLITRATLFFIFVATTVFAQQPPTVPFAQRQVKFENGVIGKPLIFESATPRNFEEIIGKATLRSVKLDGQLFVPTGTEAQAIVILAPGSGGVSADHLKHAQALTSAGLAVYVLDPFAGRGIRSTSSDQTQLTHAASAYDILAAVRMLAAQPDIDGQRIGALGYSRGGAAILLAVHQQMTRAVLGEGKSLRAALVGWPLCIFQFEHALTAPTVVRFLVGDSDNRTSPAWCQAQAMAMRAKNPHVSIRLFKDAYHGFGYSFPLREFPNIQRTRLNAPILYINDQGAFLDLHTGEPIPGIDQFTYAKKLGLAENVTAVTGTKPGQSEAFVEDMIGFFKAHLKP